jgi:hypothetical protein
MIPILERLDVINQEKGRPTVLDQRYTLDVKQ